jgi:gephyrin
MVSMEEAWRTVQEVALALAERLQQAGPVLANWDDAALQSGTAVLADAITAPWPVPRFDMALKDGYAVRSQDLLSSRTLRCIGCQVAGQVTPKVDGLAAGTCRYITTGAPLPPGADAVVPVERVQVLENETSGSAPKSSDEPFESFHILVASGYSVPAGSEVRHQGDDVAFGQVVLERGQQLGAVERSVLCSFGVQRSIPLQRVPRVAVLSTGSELCDPSASPSSLTAGSVYDSNRPLLLGLLRRYLPPSHIIDAGIASDEEVADNLAALLTNAQQDVLIISGGVSMGLSDVVKPLLAQHGRIHFGRLRMKPGKPMTFASNLCSTKRPWLAFALPGNPVSSSVCFALLVVPAIQLLKGVSIERAYPRCIIGRLAHVVVPDAERPEFQRAHLLAPTCLGSFCRSSATSESFSCFARMTEVSLTSALDSKQAESYLPLFSITGNQSSTRLQSVVHADVLVYVPPGTEPLPAGTLVHAVLLDAN